MDLCCHFKWLDSKAILYFTVAWPAQFFANYQVGKEEKKNETMSQSEENV